MNRDINGGEEEGEKQVHVFFVKPVTVISSVTK